MLLPSSVPMKATFGLRGQTLLINGLRTSMAGIWPCETATKLSRISSVIPGALIVTTFFLFLVAANLLFAFASRGSTGCAMQYRFCMIWHERLFMKQ